MVETKKTKRSKKRSTKKTKSTKRSKNTTKNGSEKTKSIAKKNRGKSTKLKNRDYTTIDSEEIHKNKKKGKVEPEWHSAVCYNAVSMAKEVRETLEKLGYSYERDRTYKPYSKLMVILPLPRFSYVFQFKISKPTNFIINIYDSQPTHSGELHNLEIEEITAENLRYVKKFLRQLSEDLPRKPWQFYWGERLRYAIAAPEYLRARKAWRKMGVD